MGYRSLAMSTSERTHQIPVEKFERAESDYRMILADLEQFVSDGSRGDLPPVFAKVSCSVVISSPTRDFSSNFLKGGGGSWVWVEPLLHRCTDGMINAMYTNYL